MRIYVAAVAGILALSMMLVFPGCSGDSTSGQHGSIGLGVVFPPRDTVSTAEEKSMPAVTNSVVIEVETVNQGAPDWSRQVIVNRPDQGAVVQSRMDSVPAGAVRVTATCFDGYDGNGNRVAEATSVTTVSANQTTNVTLTVDRLAESVGIYSAVGILQDQLLPLETLDMEPGDVYPVQAKGWCYDGTETVYVEFRWSVSDQGLSVEPAEGSITTLEAIEDGVYEVTATDGNSGEDATLEVTVESRAVASVSVEPRQSTLYRFGDPETVQLSVLALDSAAQSIGYAVIRYESSDTSVATVDADGLVSAAGPGAAVITVTATTATGTASAQCAVEVIETGDLDIIVQQDR